MDGEMKLHAGFNNGIEEPLTLGVELALSRRWYAKRWVYLNLLYLYVGVEW